MGIGEGDRNYQAIQAPPLFNASFQRVYKLIAHTITKLAERSVVERSEGGGFVGASIRDWSPEGESMFV